MSVLQFTGENVIGHVRTTQQAAYSWDPQQQFELNNILKYKAIIITKQKTNTYDQQKQQNNHQVKQQNQQ